MNSKNRTQRARQKDRKCAKKKRTTYVEQKKWISISSSISWYSFVDETRFDMSSENSERSILYAIVELKKMSRRRRCRRCRSWIRRKIRRSVFRSKLRNAQIVKRFDDELWKRFEDVLKWSENEQQTCQFEYDFLHRMWFVWKMRTAWTWMRHCHCFSFWRRHCFDQKRKWI